MFEKKIERYQKVYSSTGSHLVSVDKSFFLDVPVCPNVDTLFYTSNSEKEISIKTCFAHQQNIFLIFFSLFV